VTSVSEALARAAEFVTTAPVLRAEPFGSGHVNATFRLTDEQGRRYLLQLISRHAFPRPDQVMANVRRVTQELAAVVPDPRRRLTLVPTRDGAWWLDAAGECWRVYQFIEDSTELPAPLTVGEVEAGGRALGEFLVQVAQIPAGDLFVTIEGFHDEPRYVARLRHAAERDVAGRAGAVRDEIERALSYEAVSHDVDDTAMPQRVTHNDAKMANILFDAATHEPLCVVDLDTVQPGLAVQDFGDGIRSGAATAAEDDPDVAAVSLSLPLFEGFARGYLGACGDLLEPAEIAHLRHGARLAALETSLRFLTDYLAGDVYFRIDHPTHNLDRARNQLALLADIDRHWDELGRIVDRIGRDLGLTRETGRPGRI